MIYVFEEFGKSLGDVGGFQVMLLCDVLVDQITLKYGVWSSVEDGHEDSGNDEGYEKHN
jgi:hypothetical protein